MEKIALFNQKGGVGKTSISVNLPITLNKLFGKKILVVDCDAQANTSSYLMAYGYDDSQPLTLIDYLRRDDVGIRDCIHKVFLNVAREEKNNIVPSDIDILPITRELDKTEITDAGVLKKALAEVEEEYDYCFIDCSPQKMNGVIVALCAADYVLVPMDSGDIDSLQGYDMVLDLVDELKNSRLNDTIRILGVVINFFNKSRGAHGFIVSNLIEQFGDIIFHSMIRDSADIEKAKIFRKAICYYKPSSMITRDYESFAIELQGRIEQMNRKGGV